MVLPYGRLLSDPAFGPFRSMFHNSSECSRWLKDHERKTGIHRISRKEGALR